MGLFAPQINDVTPFDGVRVLSLETGVHDVVTIAGSLLGGDVFSPVSNNATADMTASMLDQGTEERDKFAISEILEDVGASLSFTSDNYRVRFGARCLSKDVGVHPRRINEIVHGKRSITADTALRLSRYFGWL